jgi:hypothetical protein
MLKPCQAAKRYRADSIDRWRREGRRELAKECLEMLGEFMVGSRVGTAVYWKAWAWDLKKRLEKEVL